MEQITKEKAQQLHALLKSELAAVAQKFGCTLEVSPVRYNVNEMGAKVNFRIGAENGIVFDETAKYKADLTIHGYLFGATREDAGLRDPSNGAKFIGIAVNRKKYPYVFQKLDGKLTLYPKLMFDAIKGINKK
jgi:hypothetical protein